MGPDGLRSSLVHKRPSQAQRPHRERDHHRPSPVTPDSLGFSGQPSALFTQAVTESRPLQRAACTGPRPQGRDKASPGRRRGSSRLPPARSGWWSAALGLRAPNTQHCGLERRDMVRIEPPPPPSSPGDPMPLSCPNPHPRACIPATPANLSLSGNGEPSGHNRSGRAGAWPGLAQRPPLSETDAQGPEAHSSF